MLTAHDGREALALFHAQRSQIAVVLTDLMMPGMDGPALVGELRKLGSQVPVITMSGLVEIHSSNRLSATTTAFLEKPFTAESLLGTVRTALEPAPPSLL